MLGYEWKWCFVGWVGECMTPELKTLECDILNPDMLINLEIKFMRRTRNIYSGD